MYRLLEHPYWHEDLAFVVRHPFANPLGVIGRRRDTDWRCPFHPSRTDILGASPNVRLVPIADLASTRLTLLAELLNDAASELGSGR